jgi:hypothetical protein
MAMTFGQLRALIEAEKLGWQPPVDRADDEELPLPALGERAENRLTVALKGSRSRNGSGRMTPP